MSRNFYSTETKNLGCKGGFWMSHGPTAFEILKEQIDPMEWSFIEIWRWPCTKHRVEIEIKIIGFFIMNHMRWDKRSRSSGNDIKWLCFVGSHKIFQNGKLRSSVYLWSWIKNSTGHSHINTPYTTIIFTARQNTKPKTQ